MPTLHWIGKEKVINHHLDVPFKVLKHKYGFKDGQVTEFPVDSGNKIIHGDNLEALKALLPEYEGKIKCIYIDPPYNTGNENWVYNDNVSDPRIKKWLGQVVGKESEDLTRHDKWLCMMYPRLKLLAKLLAADGTIFISIDDNELANLKLVCDEVLSAGDFVSYFTWIRKKKGSFLSKQVRKMTEYVLCYTRNTSVHFYGEDAYSDKWQPIVKRTNSSKTLIFPAKTISTTLPAGNYKKGIRGNSGTGVEFINDFEVHDNLITNSIEVLGNFVWTQDYLNEELLKGTSISLSSKFGFNVLRHNQSEKIKTPSTLINSEVGVGTNEDASADLQTIFSSEVNEVFNYSKPYTLIKYLLKMVLRDDKEAIILDSFAGSGTTAQAVLDLNRDDGGNRRFLLVEMEDYMEQVTTARVKKVIEGYDGFAGTQGSFDLYDIGESLFTSDGALNELVGVPDLRRYIFFTETRQSLTNSSFADNEYFLDQWNGTSYFFYYDQDLVTTLDHQFLASIKNKAQRYVIYADRCLLSNDFMCMHNIVFKKIPRDISKF